MTAFRCFLGSKLGLAAMFATQWSVPICCGTHTGHIWAAAPYVLLLICPLMHLFGRRHGHSHSQHSGQS